MAADASKLLKSAADKAEQKYIATEATKFAPEQAKQRLLDSVRVNYTQEDTTGNPSDAPVPVDSVDKQVAGMIQLASGFGTPEEFYKAVQDQYVASGLNPNTISNIAPLLEQSWEASRGVESTTPSQDTPVEQTAAVGSPVLSQVEAPAPVLTPKQEAVVTARETKKEVLASTVADKKLTLDPTYDLLTPSIQAGGAGASINQETLDDAEVAALEQKRVEETPINPAFAKKFKDLDTQQVSRGEFLRSQIGKNDFSERELIDQYDALRLQQVNKVPEKESYWMQTSEKDTALGQTKQLAADFVVGSNRLAYHIASALPAGAASAIIRNLGDEAVQAYSTEQMYTKAKEAIAEARKTVTDPAQLAALDQAEEQLLKPTLKQLDLLASNYIDKTNPNDPSKKSHRKMLDTAVRFLDTTEDIDTFFNKSAYIKSIVNPVFRDEYTADLTKTFEENADQLNKASVALSNGDYAEAAKEGIPALTKLIVGGFGDSLSNPAAVAGFIAENIPQLVLGAAKGGQALLGASNYAYALSVHSEGINAFQEKHNRLPTPAETSEMLAWSLTVALAEQVGDTTILKGLGLGSKPVKEALASTPTNVKGGFIKAGAGAVTKTAAAVAKPAGTITKAYVAEGGTETYQSLVEETLSKLSDEYKPKEAFISGSVGAAAGGGLVTPSTAVTALGDATSTNINKAAEIRKILAEKNAAKAAVLTEAVTTGDMTAVADKEAEGYDPVTATKAYLLRNQAEGVTPEEVTNNEAEIQQLHVEAIEAQVAHAGEMTALREAGKTGSKEYKAALKKEEELAEVTTDIGALRTAQEETTSLKGEELTAVLETVETATEDTPEFRNASQRLVNDPNLDTPTLERLVANKNIPFTPGQEARLRHRLNKQRALDQLKDESEVHQDVIYGGKGKFGLTQYQDKVNSAVVRNKEGDARGAVAALAKFADRHEAKVNLIQDAYAEVQGTDNTIQLVPVDTEVESIGKWERAQKVYTAKELKNLGGLRIHRNSNVGDTRFIENLGFEKDALLAGLAESEAIIDNAFGPAKNPAEGSQSTQKPTSPTTDTNAPATPTPAPTAATARLDGFIQEFPETKTAKTVLVQRENGTITPKGEAFALAWFDKNAGKLRKTSKPKPTVNKEAEVARLNKEIDAVEKQLEELDASIAKAFPNAEELNDIPQETISQRADLESKLEDLDSQLDAVVNPKKPQATPPPTPQETTPTVTEEVATVGTTEEIERTARDLDAAEQQLQELEEQLHVDFPDSALLITAPDERLDEISELEESIAALQEELDNLSAPAPEAAYDLGAELTTEQVVNPQPSVTKETSFSVFQKLNLVARNFVYKGERDGKAYVNPLNSVRDVVAKMNQGLDFLLEFSKKNDFTAKQIQTLSTFAKKAAKWDNTFLQKVWLALPATQSGFRHRDYIQFLAKDGELDPNVRAAIHLGIYQWLTTQANNLVNNDEEAIAGILGIQKEQVTSAMVSKLHDMGSYQHVVAAAIGKDIVKALGLKATDFAGTNNQGQLEQSMGMAAVNIMLQEGYIERTFVKQSDVLQLTSDTAVATSLVESQFIRPAVRKGVDENGVELRYDVVSKEIQDLIDINKDTNGIIPELFSVQDPVVGASLAPFKVKKGRASIKGNQQKASQEQTDIVNDAGKRKHSLKQNVHKALTFLGYDNLLDIEGYNRTNETTSHVDNIAVVDSKNAQIAKGILDHFSFVDSIQTWNDGAGLASPFYFAYDIWSNNRMGMKGSGENIQANKFQRHAVTENSWIEEVSLNPSSESFQRFLLAVGESLGVGTDKQLNTTSFEQISSKLREPVIVTGLEALVAVLTDSVPAGQEAQYQADITAAVNAGGEKTYSLDGLTNYAEYLIARKDPKVKTFTSNLFREVDGKTNGPMLGLIQLAAKGTVEELLEVLESGGFYKPGEAKSFSEWNTSPLNNDIYIKTLGTWVNNVAKKTNTAPLKGYWTGPEGKKTKVNPQSVWRAVGSVLNGTDGDLVRDNVKNPLTITFFGAKDFSIKAQISDLFMNKVREQLEAIAANTDRAQAQVDLNNLNYNLALASDNKFNRVIQLDEALTFTFTKPEETALFFSVVGTYGDTLSASIEEHYGMFKRTREVANEAIKVVSEGFRLQYDFMVQKKIKELVATGDIPSRIVKGQEEIYGTLSQNQRNEILVEVGKSIPLIANYFSTLSGNTDEHLDLSRSRQATQSGEAYKTTQKTKTKIKGNGADGNPKWTSEASGHSTDLVYRDSGVAPLITTLHSTDAAISALVLKAFESLNVHDAHGFASSDAPAGAKALNKATLDVMSGYSLLSSMRDTLTQSLEALKAFEETHGAEAQVDGKSISLVIAETVAKDMEEHPQFGEVKVDSHKKALVVLQYMQDLMAYEAANADKKKLEALSQLGHISQYNLEGGQYDLTPEDVAALKKQAESIVVPDVPVLEQVEETVEPSQVLITDEINVSDPDIVSYLSQENPSVSGLIDLMSKSFDLRKKGAYNSAQLIRKSLLTELKKRMPADVTVVLVNEDNVKTLPKQVQKDLQGSRGMYAPATSTIYVMEGSGTNSETITHELLHAILHRLLSTTRSHIKSGKSVVPEANEMYKSLFSILQQAREYIKDKPELIAEFSETNAFANVSEMVSWAMTNASFQEKVLGAIMVKEPSTNKFIDGMTTFLKAIRKYLFKGTAAATSSTALTGLEEVVRLTSGLMKLEGKHRQTYNTVPIPLVAKQTTDQQVYDMTAEELFDGLGQTNTVPSTPAQESRIKAILSGIVTKVHGPFGINYKSAQGTEHATPLDMFLQNMIDKTAQVYSSASVNGFALNSQEAYVLEQIEATMKAGINGTSFAAKDLERLWTGVRKQVKPEHFLSVPWADATQQEQELATSKWNYLFVPVTGPDGKADYLHRFASIGMVDEQFQNILTGLDVSLSRNEAAPTNVYERIQHIFNKILEVISGWVTHVNQTDKANAKLDTLLKQMVLVDTKKKSSLYKLLSLAGNTSIDTLDTLVKKTKEGLVSVATSRRVRESSSAVVGAVGVGVDIVLGDKVEALMDVGEKISNKYRKGREGMVAGLVTEARGDHKGTWRFFELLRKSKHAIDSARQAATTNMTNLVSSEFVNAGKDLTTAMKVAVTKAVIRTDMQSLLGTYSYQELERLLSDPTYLNSEISKATVNMRVSFGNTTGLVYVNESAALGYMMATGKVTSEYLQRNAHNIYNHGGTTRVGTANPALEAAGIAAIDVLTSLHAIKYTSTSVKQTASQVLLTELTAGQNKGGNLTDVHGFSFVMKMHQRLIQEANEKLFDNNPIHFVKGYTKDITNPHISFVVASGSPSKKLFMEQQGYTQGKRVPKDPTDPNNIEPVYVYHSRDGGIAGYLSGILSQTSRASQGTSLSQAIFQNGDGSNSSMARAHTSSITAARQSREAAHFSPTRVFDPRQEKSNMLLASIDNSGRVTDYRYVMAEEHRDILLERDDRFDKVLGAMAGSVVDKDASKEINTKTIQALHDQYREDFAAQSLSYLEVSATSSDPRLKEIWHMIPDEAKADVKRIWGGKKMLVRKDILDITFGYRKHSVADKFKKEAEERTVYEQIFINVANTILRTNAANKLRRVEDVWQEIVREAKDILVIKNFFTLLGNEISNATVLMVQGVPLLDIIKYKREGFNGIYEYQQITEEIYKLDALLKAGQLPNTIAATEQRLAVLRNKLENNPVKELIDEGVFQAIVEDIDMTSDAFSYKNKLSTFIDEKTAFIPEGIKQAARVVYLSHDTVGYKILNHGTQYSDFTSRYTSYKHLTTRTENRMSKKDALRKIVSDFVAYDPPSSKGLQYGNDNGIVWFSKYYIRIQKPLFNMFKDNPGNAMSLLAAQELIGDFQAINDSSILSNSIFNRLHNPFTTVLGAPDEIITVGAAMDIMGL